MEQKFISGYELGNILCQMFNIDPNNVVSISVTAEIGELATVELTTRPIWADGWRVTQTFDLVEHK